jgi:hypothetical protein
VSSRHTRGLFGILLAAIFAFGAIAAGPASAKLTKHQKKVIRHQLMRQIKKNPRAINKRSFIKKASLVDFKLPTTIRLNPAKDQNGNFVNSDDQASIDLGPSLGVRTVGLGGKIPAVIEFNDAYDGGTLGDVRITLPPAASVADRGVTTTSVPLLTNADTTNNTQAAGGCSDFTGGTQGVDDIAAIAGSDGTQPGSAFDLGAGPYSPEANTEAGDTVLRTGPLSLGVETPNTFDDANSPVGVSGGRANLFGAPVGKQQVDVKVNLVTNINSILREVDGALPSPNPGSNWHDGNIAALFNCRQAWSGYVENHISTNLIGTLKIAPAITADGKLRIAKVFLQSNTPTNLSLAACLSPYYLYAQGNPLAGDALTTPPAGGPSYNGTPPFDPSQSINPAAPSDAPNVACDAAGGPLDRDPFNVSPISALGNADPLTNGSEVNVLGTIRVDTLNAEVLIGNV